MFELYVERLVFQVSNTDLSYIFSRLFTWHVCRGINAVYNNCANLYSRKLIGDNFIVSKVIKIGGASGFWGESMCATPQLLAAGDIDYIVYDFLAEITMSILGRARASDSARGYATDFVTGVLAPNLGEIARQNVKILSNAGGVNPSACAIAVRALIEEQGLDLKVAVIEGDDLYPRRSDFVDSHEMFSNLSFPDVSSIASMNAYLGAFPIARALRLGADIVITGRSVDSAVTLGACIASFDWAWDDWCRLSGGSLAGHIIECGPQASGGNFTDWHLSDRISEIGYPIVEVSSDGSFVCTKPPGTGGVVSVGTVSEQMLYEIGDPQAYILPDVICDFSSVELEQDSIDRVRVFGARGYPAPSRYKVSMTYFDGFRGGSLVSFIGLDAGPKADVFAAAIFTRARDYFRSHNMADFSETSVEVIGTDSQYGCVPDDPRVSGVREVVLKFAAKHPDQKGISVMLKEATGLGLSGPPGLSGFAGARSKASPVVRLFSYLVAKSELNILIDCEGISENFNESVPPEFDLADISRPAPPPSVPSDVATTDVPLVKLAWGRSGDKGNKANIGIIARKPEYIPYIWAVLTENAIMAHFAHFLENSDSVSRFYLPGSHSINYLLDNALGGGGIASLRNDPQAKAYAQLVLDYPIPVPLELAERL